MLSWGIKEQGVQYNDFFYKILPSFLKQSNQTLTRRDWNAPLQQPPSSWMHQKYFRALFHLLEHNIRGVTVYIYKDGRTNVFRAVSAFPDISKLYNAMMRVHLVNMCEKGTKPMEK